MPSCYNANNYACQEPVGNVLSPVAAAATSWHAKSLSRQDCCLEALLLVPAALNREDDAVTAAASSWSWADKEAAPILQRAAHAVSVMQAVPERAERVDMAEQLSRNGRRRRACVPLDEMLGRGL